MLSSRERSTLKPGRAVPAWMPLMETTEPSGFFNFFLVCLPWVLEPKHLCLVQDCGTIWWQV